MGTTEKKRTINWYRVVGLIIPALFFVFAMCIQIDLVTQQSTAMVGEEITVTVDITVSNDDDFDSEYRFVFGFLAPRSWAAANNSTVTYTSGLGDGTMAPVGAEELDPKTGGKWANAMRGGAGIGNNYGEVEWVVFKSNETFLAPDGTTGTVTLTTTVGDENVITQLGYLATNDVYGIDADNFDFEFTDCIEVTGAAGDTLNLCGPAPPRVVVVEPETYNFNDILTITYDANESLTPLVNPSQVYFCSTATHVNGTENICQQDAKTEMEDMGGGFWQITLWPRDYYGLSADDLISELAVSFSDGSNTDLNGGKAYKVIEKCF